VDKKKPAAPGPVILDIRRLRVVDKKSGVERSDGIILASSVAAKSLARWRGGQRASRTAGGYWRLPDGQGQRARQLARALDLTGNKIRTAVRAGNHASPTVPRRPPARSLIMDYQAWENTASAITKDPPTAAVC